MNVKHCHCTSDLLLQPNPWGSTDPASTDVPNTGAVRSYKFSVSRAIKAPDGYQKSVILINGQFPGPLIEANWGDTIEVTVTNDIEDTAEGVTLHWHGQPQHLSPGEDGVPGVSQCPIPPGSSLTYRFRAEYFGTGWYHSHVSGQYTDGLYGPMVIYGPTQVPYDIDLGPVMLSDYSHTSYYDILKSAYLFPPVFPTIDNNLINGKGIFECNSADESICTPWAGFSKFAFRAGKVHRIRLINTGGEGTQKFSIDSHVLKVIANDYVPVEPYETDVVTLGIGQRTDILVTASGAVDGAYWMRSDIDETCLNLTAVNSHALAAIYYPHSDTNAVPKTTATSWSSNNCQNDPLNQTIPYYPTTPPSEPATTTHVVITVGQNATGEFIFFMNGTSFEVDYKCVPLFLVPYLKPFLRNMRLNNYFEKNSYPSQIHTKDPSMISSYLANDEY
ncbi:hypothetical protein EIK77_001747 [Talaromyces pinophilus]|nr:hypothetical protein EIK77_001747 [Talaromyces pinophilus]